VADTVIPTAAVQRRSHSALWYGLLITLLGIASEFAYLLRLPPALVRVLPWINLALPAIGAIFLIVGLARAFGRPAIYRGKIWGSVVTVVALLLVAANVMFFYKVRDVPKSAGAPQVGQQAPDFTLADSLGQPTSLSQMLATPANGAPTKAVLLIFYRGYW
jgi:hypothetical protein